MNSLKLDDCLNYYGFEEILQWDCAHHKRTVERMFKTKKVYKDPRRIRLMNYRHHNKVVHYNKECAYYRRMTTRALRAQWRHDKHNFLSQIEFENYLRPVNHCYKTSGWLTW